jgi:hypothetical protein
MKVFMWRVQCYICLVLHICIFGKDMKLFILGIIGSICCKQLKRKDCFISVTHPSRFLANARIEFCLFKTAYNCKSCSDPTKCASDCLCQKSCKVTMDDIVFWICLCMRLVVRGLEVLYYTRNHVSSCKLGTWACWLWHGWSSPWRQSSCTCQRTRGRQQSVATKKG